MKLGWKDIDPFVKKPNPAARVILVYGPDDGLVKERAKSMGQTIVADLNDPFNVSILSADQIAENAGRLIDEASAMSMMGGARLIRVSDGGDKIAPTIKSYLENPSKDNLVIIEAGELGPKSPLRALCEKSAAAAAVPCYVEDEKGISQLIRDKLKGSGFSIQSDAQEWMASAILGDRLRAVSEIEKLITYMGKPPANISLEDVQAACGDAGAQTLDDLIYAVASGRAEAAMRSYAKLEEEGMAAIAILRSLQNHFRKLHLCRALLDNGSMMEDVIKGLQPPLFFKLEQPFKMQLSKWSLDGLSRVLERLSQLEAQTKQTGTPVETLLAQALLSLSRQAGTAKAA